jgi:hypothetical protein
MRFSLSFCLFEVLGFHFSSLFRTRFVIQTYYVDVCLHVLSPFSPYLTMIPATLQPPHSSSTKDSRRTGSRLLSSFYLAACVCLLTEVSPDWSVSWMKCLLTEVSPDWSVSWLKCLLTEVSPDWSAPTLLTQSFDFLSFI